MNHTRIPMNRTSAAALLLSLLLVAAGACRSETSDVADETSAGPGAAKPAATTDRAPAPALDPGPLELPPAALEALRTALTAYEDARALLAADAVDGLAPRAERLARSLAMAEEALAAEPQAKRYVAEAAAAARSLGAAESLDESEGLPAARQAFGEVSRFLIALAGADPRLAEGWQVYECPMTDEVFAKWMQPRGDLENPYMGPEMLSCGGESDWTAAAPVTFEELTSHVEHVHGGDVAYYTCSMHPSVRGEGPGTCPICSMDLTPVSREELDTGVIRIDSQRRQEIGVRTARVAVEPVDVTIRAVGMVTWDETRLSAVSLKNEGWIGKLYVEETGQAVRRGQTLLTLYSPALLAAQEELLAVLESQRAARATAAPERADYLVEAARRRLALWDLTPGQIDQIVASGKPVQYLPIYSPASGFVVEKNVVEGEAVKPGQTLFKIAGLDRVWVDAEVYESELPLVRLGQPAEVSFPYVPGKSFRGTVDYIYPALQAGTRTAKVRVTLPNPGLELKPEMYANVVLTAHHGERLLVPEEAVIYAGTRRLVFVDLGEGRLQPREIEVGLKAGDAYEVLAGLTAGELVVTSGNFLIAAESRLKSATEQW